MTSVLSPLRLRLRFVTPASGKTQRGVSPQTDLQRGKAQNKVRLNGKPNGKPSGKPNGKPNEIPNKVPNKLHNQAQGKDISTNGTGTNGTGTRVANLGSKNTTRKNTTELLILPATELGGTELALTLRTHPRARHLSLRLDSKRGQFVLVRPRRVSQRAARDFALRNRAWMDSKLSALAPRVRLEAGAEFPLHGTPVRLAIDANLPRGKSPHLCEGALRFAPPTNTLEQRCVQWLRARARTDLEARIAQFLSLLAEHEKSNRRTSLTLARLLRDNKKPSLRLTDPTTRWGSCSRTGRMAFSWRLVLAPEFVADYVVAHEVVHLRHFHHGESFWRTLDSLAVETEAAKDWLAHHGDELLRYGPPPATGESATRESKGAQIPLHEVAGKN